MNRRHTILPDLVAILVLAGLWLLFFWRLFTSVEADQASLEKGDFSGQFVAFGSYQYARLSAGEVPLWNPYNNGGLPFLADTQAAVFYPPRLATIFLSKLAGGWTYHALELEMTVHVLAYSLLMYVLIRRLTLGNKGSIFGALTTAIVASYGGFLTSYPPLQLALLEAGIWLPLAILGIYEATQRERIYWGGLVLTGLALGLSWMAGHPQTSYFLTLLLVAYLAFRVYRKRYSWRTFAAGVLLFGLIAGGMAAVQLLPGLEYLPLTSRPGFGFDEKGNGFPFHDIIQFILPNVVSQWSPLYVGIPALALALVAVWRRVSDSLFWGIVALVALTLSFGANSPVFALLYNVLPGMRFFRGQERAAYLVANSLAILAGLGSAHLANWDQEQLQIGKRGIQRGWVALAGLSLVGAALVFSQWFNQREALNGVLSTSVLVTVLTLITIGLLLNIVKKPGYSIYHWLLVGAIVFELFSINMDRDSNYDSVPPDEQLSMTPPPIVQTALIDRDIPFRVDGYRGIHDNYGSLYGLADIRGISPLFLESAHRIIENGLINPIAWELFAVRYVYTDWDELPAPSRILETGQDRYGSVKLHQLSDPRPFALMVFNATYAPDDDTAQRILKQEGFNPRHTIIVNREVQAPLQASTDISATAEITHYTPEHITIDVNTEADGILSIANPDYPGWMATIDGQPTEILRAYGALQAVVVPEGAHTIQLIFDPPSYKIGAALSILTWGAIGLWGITTSIRRGRYASN